MSSENTVAQGSQILYSPAGFAHVKTCPNSVEDST